MVGGCIGTSEASKCAVVVGIQVPRKWRRKDPGVWKQVPSLRLRGSCIGLGSRVSQAFTLRNSSLTVPRAQDMALPATAPTETEAQGEVALERGLNVGQLKLQGRRDEMEDDVVVHLDGPLGFTFAAVFDGHSGFSSATFLRNELYRECLEMLEGGALLESDDHEVVEASLRRAFLQTDRRLLSWLSFTGR